ncbi:hypothetical protein QP994_03230 [Corynebacterium sp. MSK044]|uniref:hypothetical protein n=1 Tax=Corynebacterium sp. MSK044 TaxID=3050195 RepID=UPI00254B088A|nr:hypothetical protein [Corynebacterium sp. MSK044]MDK8796894.1 hypothetical protein [Corynebacterium sp. MSK044]
MAHYDLYNSLGLDRSADPATLAQELDNRINSGIATNPGGIEELRIARDILGDPQRRSLYDQKLNDVNAPDINIAALRDLAQANFGGAPAGAAGAAGAQGFAPGQPQSEQGPSTFDKGRETFTEYSKMAQERLNPAMEKTKSEIARSSKGVILGTAVATALVMLLIWGLVAGIGGGDRNASKAQKLTNQFLELRTNEETERWLIDNSLSESRSDILDELEVNDGFSGVDNYFKASDPKAGEVLDARDFLYIFTKTDDEAYERALKDELGADAAYFVEVRNKNGSSSGGAVFVVIQDGKARLADFQFANRDASDFFSDYK